MAPILVLADTDRPPDEERESMLLHGAYIVGKDRGKDGKMIKALASQAAAAVPPLFPPTLLMLDLR